MKTAFLSLVAAAALAVSAGSADARPPAHRGGYNHSYYGGYRGGYVRPVYASPYVYPTYGYSNYGYSNYGYGYNSGFGLNVGGVGLSIIAPTYGNGGYLYQPYSYGYGGYAGRLYGW